MTWRELAEHPGYPTSEDYHQRYLAWRKNYLLQGFDGSVGSGYPSGEDCQAASESSIGECFTQRTLALTFASNSESDADAHHRYDTGQAKTAGDGRQDKRHR